MNRVDWEARAVVFDDMAARYRAVPHGKENHEMHAKVAEREAARLRSKIRG